ncbi:MAG: carboxypeptidase-like regulatory domain-containing protein, partial [Polyangiaceae bacterium]
AVATAGPSALDAVANTLRSFVTKADIRAACKEFGASMQAKRAAKEMATGQSGCEEPAANEAPVLKRGDEVELAQEHHHQLGVSLAALEQKGQTLAIASSTIPSGVCRVGVFLFGKSASGVPASARSYFTLRNPNQRPLTDAAWLAVLKQVIDGHLVADPDHITQEDLVRLSYEGKITLPDAAPQFQSDGVIAFGLPDPGTLGASCRPGDVPAAGIQDLTCQAAFDQNGFPDLAGSLPQIRNALKGDAVLSVSCSFVGTMLRSLNPPQLFSHTGIMLKNNEVLRDSTADEDRMVAALDAATSKGPLSPPLVGSTLRYAWPGAITETVSEAYLGHELTDPDGTKRTLHTFNNVLKKCDGDRTVTGGRVLKAAPGSGDVGRAPLRAAANAAVAVESSYSFFGYTRSDLMAQQVGGADAPAWASNKIRTECSSFIWQSFNAAATGVEIEGQLEDNDLAFSGMFQTAVDGLYGYTSQQRKAAANTLFGQVYNLAQDKGGIAAQVFQAINLDYPTIVADFVTNCFAFDDCADASPRWRDNGLGEGIAVSPDNMLLWDIYGTNEPLQLDQMTATRQYRFAPSVGAANVSGHVVDAKGNPVALANVVIKAPDGSGGTLDTQTGADGSFEFDAVRAGTYVVDADKIINTIDNKGHKDVTIASGTPVPDLVIIIEQDPRRRLFNVVGIMGELRDIDNAGDEFIGPVNIDYHLQVNPDVPSASAPFEQCVDHDVHLKAVFSATLDALDLQTLHVCATQGLRDAGIGENACNTDPKQSTPLCVDLAPGASTTFNDGGAFDSSNYKADYSVVVSNTAELAP